MKIDGKDRWEQLVRLLKSSTGRLAVSYLAVIMGMSLGYSVVLYNASAKELRRQVPPPTAFQNQSFSDDFSTSPQVHDFFEGRLAEGRQALMNRLIILNMLTLVVGGGLSYYLARRTLKPIEDSMEAQSQFVSDASHELRTPLTTMLTTNEVGLRDAKLTLAHSKVLLKQNIEEVIKLQALTDGLLKLAKQDNDEVLHAEAVSLQDVVADAMNQVVSLAQAKEMTVDDKVPAITVPADRQCLIQSVVILLDNAIKYGPPGSTITLRASKKAKIVQLSVQDEGPGIRPYDMRRIFDRFYRADQSRSNQHVPGHGIGLSLAKKIIKQHGGDITVTSTVGKGSMFTITLPLSSAPGALSRP